VFVWRRDIDGKARERELVDLRDVSEETGIVSWFPSCCSDADERSGGEETMGVSHTGLDDGE
jgi:hypothetical protein